MSTLTDVLVIAPHPDDIEFGAAGTLGLWAHEGRQVVYALCTSGEKGTSDRTITPEKLAAIRENEQRAAASLVGAADVVFLRYPDQGLEETAGFRKHLVRLIRTYRPGIVMTVDPYRRYIYHRDHRITGRVVLDAVFPYARDHMAYPDLLEEGLEPHKVREVWLWYSEEVNCRVDITGTFDLKLAALRCHESQVQEFVSADPETMLRKRCRDMAGEESFELAEAFHRVELPL